VRYGGNTPCVEVRAADGPVVILDAGSGIRLLGQEMMRSGDRETPLHLFLTHRHSDHVQGLPHFAPLFVGPRDIAICCGDGEHASVPPFVASLLTPPLFPHVDGLAEAIAVCEWPAGNHLDVGSLYLTRCVARHPGDAAIFVVHDAQGALIAYAPDNELGYTQADPAITRWREALAASLRGIPLLVHDATFLSEELPRHVGWGHSSSEEAVRFAIECEAGMLLLFHHHPDRDDDTIERMVDDARAQVAAAGSTLRVMAAWEGLGLSV
jgi:hypothetical protein